MSTASRRRTPAQRLLTIVLTLAVLAVGGYFGLNLQGTPSQPSSSSVRTAPAGASQQSNANSGHETIARLMREQRSEVMVTLKSRVVHILEDDNEGSRHQRLLLAIDAADAPEDSVLIAHNIDLAPRVPVEKGEWVTVRGQYEYNDLGGVIHWTHHDPRKRREGGWIEHRGERYE